LVIKKTAIRAINRIVPVNIISALILHHNQFASSPAVFEEIPPPIPDFFDGFSNKFIIYNSSKFIQCKE
jgi:hypothetical protein